MSNFSNKVNNTKYEYMVTCSNCGRCWDGYAQCCCHGIPIDDDSETKQKTRTHTMTLRSDTKDTKEYTKSNEIHPESWNEYTHYGQCGQSCPCCRTMVGDKWGACSICIK